MQGSTVALVVLLSLVTLASMALTNSTIHQSTVHSTASSLANGSTVSSTSKVTSEKHEPQTTKKHKYYHGKTTEGFQVRTQAIIAVTLLSVVLCSIGTILFCTYTEGKLCFGGGQSDESVPLPKAASGTTLKKIGTSKFSRGTGQSKGTGKSNQNPASSAVKSRASSADGLKSKVPASKSQARSGVKSTVKSRASSAGGAKSSVAASKSQARSGIKSKAK